MRLIFRAFNGTSYRLDQGTLAEMQEAARNLCEKRRCEGYDVDVLTSGREWEIQIEGYGVSDREGTLSIEDDDALSAEYGDRRRRLVGCGDYDE